ncbi:MAG: hypothetical protein AAF401_12270 [Pseudomonadota bacterium]
MDALQSFVENNLLLVLIGGFLLVVAADEVLGVSRGLLGDEGDDASFTAKNRAKAEAEEPVDPLDRLAEENEGEESIEDMLGRK